MKQQRNWRFLLLNIDVAIASIAMCVLVGLTFAGVVARYILGSPFTWIEEIQAAMIVWVIFGAAAVCEHHHVLYGQVAQEQQRDNGHEQDQDVDYVLYRFGEKRGNPKFCVTAKSGANREKFIMGGRRVKRLPPC